MPREFVLPELAESVVEGEIVRWLVAEGDTVAEDQPVVEVMTDKVTVELPSPFAGVLEKQLAREGDVVNVNEAIALFGDGADEGAAAGGANGAAGAEAAPGAPVVDGSFAEPGAKAPSEGASPSDGEELSLFRASAVDDGALITVRKPGGGTPVDGGASGTSAAGATPGRPTGPYGRVLAVPAARRLARELGVAIESVPGSGPNGRVRLDDVRAHHEATGRPAAPSGRSRPSPVRPTTPEGYAEREERLPLRGLRRAISNQMVASHLQAVRTLHVDEADVGALVAMRDKLKGMAEARGVKLSYLPFIMKATVAALRAFPMLNASLDEEAGEIVRKHYFNFGVAVATDAGLVVPVVRDVEAKSVLELADEVQDVAARARDGKLAPDDVRGGTFSITNIGSLGGLFSFPIINVPEAAILGVHTIKKRPVVLDDDRIVARPMLYLSLSFDHRLVDGAEAARFTSTLIELLETPESLLLGL